MFSVLNFTTTAFNQVNGQFGEVLLLRDKQTFDPDWPLWLQCMIGLEKLASRCFSFSFRAKIKLLV